MTALVFKTETKFEMGDIVCVNDGVAVPYEKSLPVVGTAYVLTEGYNPSGRNYFAIDGPPYYENDQYEFKDDMSSDYFIINPNYAPFNPLNDPSYVTVFTSGMAPLKRKLEGIPSSWILLKSKEQYDWYLIR